METLTKAWFYSRGDTRQRDPEIMQLHREKYGITGNCFDLALWLLHEFQQGGIEAYPVGHDLNTSSAHVAVIALGDEGERYLCDLGDQWLQPVLIEGRHSLFKTSKLEGFFPASDIQVFPGESEVEVLYHRPNGKTSRQVYELSPINIDSFMEAADRSQSDVKSDPLLEVRIPYKNEIAHWEFGDWKSFLSTTEGRFYDAPLHSISEWVERIHGKTGYDKEMLEEALMFYQRKRKD
ncbi:hypothetical protein FZC84_20120 [Rossellomorea vietnamensis]|uniref:Arylamine N-acetyltransferase n=2 Tax=Bacillales TaxID=1385 RepID=A0A5D4M614_9BACI|nr:hypothetical protein FZC84_20120 [Rossellomorea vietnamensis]